MEADFPLWVIGTLVFMVALEAWWSHKTRNSGRASPSRNPS